MQLEEMNGKKAAVKYTLPISLVWSKFYSGGDFKSPPELYSLKNQHFITDFQQKSIFFKIICTFTKYKQLQCF